MRRDQLSRVSERLANLAQARLHWIAFATEATEELRKAVPFSRSCWHIVDPGTVLFTGSLNQNTACSGAWLAQHEYVIEDVNKWSFLAHSGRRAGATSLATHGDLSQSARHRSHEAYGIGDELRAAFVESGAYWAAVGLLRDADAPWFTEDDVRFLASLSETIARGFRGSLLTGWQSDARRPEDAPGVVVFDQQGNAESISPAAEYWVGQMIEVPAPATPADSRILQAVAARARSLLPTQDPLELAARSRVQTKSRRWLLLYGTCLSGGAAGRTAVIIQPAASHEVAPLVAMAYGLSEREVEVTSLCMKGLSTQEMATTLCLSAYTVQDHLKSIFKKTGTRGRGELVGQIFLEHYVPRWEDVAKPPSGWSAKATLPPRGPGQQI